MNLSLHFPLKDALFSSNAIRLGIPNVPTQEIIDNMVEAAQQLEVVRVLLGNHPIYVDSWFRSPVLNAAVRGSKTSSHLDGWAIDFLCPAFGEPIDIVRAIADSGIKFDQLIQEGHWTHISFDPRMRGEVMTAHFDENGNAHYQTGIHVS